MELSLTFNPEDGHDLKRLLRLLEQLTDAALTDAPKEVIPPTDALVMDAGPVPDVPPLPDAPDPKLAARQQAAANARAAKAKKDAAEKAARDAQVQAQVASNPLDDVLGPPVEVGTNSNGGGPLDDLGLDAPTASMSPGEARDAGLAIVREVYAAGKVVEVKNLQKAWGVAKFYDVPVERGHEFYAQALKIAHDTGLRR